MKLFFTIFGAILAAALVLLGGYAYVQHDAKERDNWRRAAEFSMHSMTIIERMEYGEKRDREMAAQKKAMRELLERAGPQLDPATAARLRRYLDEG